MAKDEQLFKVDNAVFEACGQLHQLALRACEAKNPDLVHYILTETRRIERLPRILKMRMGFE